MPRFNADILAGAQGRAAIFPINVKMPAESFVRIDLQNLTIWPQRTFDLNGFPLRNEYQPLLKPAGEDAIGIQRWLGARPVKNSQQSSAGKLLPALHDKSHRHHVRIRVVLMLK